MLAAFLIDCLLVVLAGEQCVPQVDLLPQVGQQRKIGVHILVMTVVYCCKMC